MRGQPKTHGAALHPLDPLNNNGNTPRKGNNNGEGSNKQNKQMEGNRHGAAAGNQNLPDSSPPKKAYYS